MPTPPHDEHRGLEVPKQTEHAYRNVDLPEVSRNAIILPPLGEGGRVGSSSSRSEANQHQRNGRGERKHGSTGTSTTTSTSTSIRNSAFADAKADVGEVCETKNEEISQGAGNGDTVVGAARTALAGVKDREKGEKGSKADDAPDAMNVEPPDGTSVDPDISAAADTLSRGREERGVDPVSPVSVIRARVGGGLRNLLALGSEAQVSPTLGSPQHATGKETNRSSNKQNDSKGLSPLSWGRLKPGRTRKEPVEKKVLRQALFSANSLTVRDGDDGDNNKKVDRETDEACHGDDDERRPTSGDGEDSTKSRANYLPDQEETATKALAPASAASAAAAAAATAETVDNTRKVLARENTLISCDEWPEVLDDEADPADWALDKGEGEVLAAARSMGSVLVRVVTWNLHAKPTPSAEKLRKALLPPGKV